MTHRFPDLVNVSVGRERQTLYIVTAALIGLAWLIQHETANSMMRVWVLSKAFNHCFLIFPLSGYLIWCKRRQLREIDIQPSVVGLLLALITALLWIAGIATQVSFLQHLSLVAVGPVVVLSTLGIRFTWAIRFPIAYSFFAVPFGLWAIPPLMNFTADFSVSMLRLTGIPVFSEGSFIYIPNGTFRVAEACAGIRFVIASMALGTLYAYLAYSSSLKRIIFFSMSIIVPIIANGLRAFGIIIIGHFSDMKLATGVDHVVYGFVFFSFIIILMIWIGGFWADWGEDETLNSNKNESNRVIVRFIPSIIYSMLSFLILLLPILAFSASLAFPHDGNEFGRTKVPIQPEQKDAFVLPSDGWEPAFRGASLTRYKKFAVQDRVADFFLIGFAQEGPDGEIISSKNVVADPEKWKKIRQTLVDLHFDDKQVLAKEILIKSDNNRRVLWYWYQVDGKWTGRDAHAKLLLGISQILGRKTPSFVIFISANYDEDPEEARRVLESVLQINMSEIRFQLSMEERALNLQ